MAMVSQELLDILRCPDCVHNGSEAGLLDHVGNWLVCKDCDRKYPIREDIPVMLIEEGDRFRDVPREELPEIPPPEERAPLASLPALPQSAEDRQKLILAIVGLALGIGVVVLGVMWVLRNREEE
jgi:uncharacterized protein YbaR (Trm112 family)